jgi:hypothetical protein
MSRARVKIPFRLTPDGKICWDNIKGAGSLCTRVIEDVSRTIAVEHLGPATSEMHKLIETDVETSVDA